MNEQVKDIITVARFGACLASIAVESYLGKAVAFGRAIALLPKVPGLLGALPKIRAEWDAMGDDDNWRAVVDAVKEDFDLTIDAVEELIEEAVEIALGILSRLSGLARRWVEYKRVK